MNGYRFSVYDGETCTFTNMYSRQDAIFLFTVVSNLSRFIREASKGHALILKLYDEDGALVSRKQVLVNNKSVLMFLHSIHEPND